VPCRLAGFDAPPGHIHLKFFPAGPAWRVIILTASGQTAPVGQWLLQHCEAVLHVPAEVGARVLRADIEVLPEAWLPFADARGVHHVDLTPSGTVRGVRAGHRLLGHPSIPQAKC
jgi:hypothetical protein